MITYTMYRPASMIPGKNPASAIPRSTREMFSQVAFGMNAINVATSPQLTMMRAIQRRAGR